MPYHAKYSLCKCTPQHPIQCDHEKFALFLHQIGLERSRLIELEEKANSLQGKIGTQRKAMGGVNAAREANIQVVLLSSSVTTQSFTG